MNNDHLKKIIIAIISLFMTGNIIMTAISGLLMPQLNRIVYMQSGAENLICEIDFDSMKIRTTLESQNGSQNRWLVGNLSRWSAFCLKFSAAFAHLPLWKENYNPTNGEQTTEYWTVQIRFGNNVHKISGSDIKPINWKMLIGKIEKFTAVAYYATESNIIESEVPLMGVEM